MRGARRPLQVDALIAAATTLGVMALAARFEWSESLYAYTRQWESLQLDEWPIALLALTACLAGMTYSRFRQAVVELRARLVVEARLEAALAENRRLAHEHVRRQEHERRHLARELHDELGQYTNAIKLDAVAMAGERDERALAVASTRILDAVNHMHQVLGNMIRRLRPAGLDELGLLAAIEHNVQHWRQRLPHTHVSLHVSGNFDDLGDLAKITAYRLVQECLTNSSNHAQATQVEVLLRREENSANRSDELLLAVSDDGQGMDPSAAHRGFGLSGMRERVEMMGGRFRIETRPGQGFSMEACLPASGSPA